MFGKLFSLRAAAFSLAISGILHILAIVLSGMSNDSRLLASAGLIYLVLAFLLSRGIRWIAYPAFLVLLIGFIFAFTYSYTGTTVPAWLYGTISLFDMTAIISLFGALWRGKAAKSY